jgi:hypothetical protein
MPITGLHLLLTLRCTGECDHCFVWGSPRATGAMSLELIRGIADQAEELGTVKGIFFEGGEPLLYYGTLLEGIRDVHRRGFQTGIVTNAYWATTVEDAKATLRPLMDAGLGSVTLSSDLFHGSEMVTSEYRAGSQAARELGLSESVIIVEPPGSCLELTPRGEPVKGGRVMFRGRAAAKLAPGAKQVPVESLTECTREALAEPSRLHVDPFGNLHLCQGLVMGNLTRRRLRDIVAEYRPDTDPVIGPLLRGGPLGLARTHGLAIQPTYADACHLCYEARWTLRARYPETLTPGQMYGEGLE